MRLDLLVAFGRRLPSRRLRARREPSSQEYARSVIDHVRLRADLGDRDVLRRPRVDDLGHVRDTRLAHKHDAYDDPCYDLFCVHFRGAPPA